MYKRILRRFLPFMLSVTMTVEMIPATAFASEIVPEVNETEEVLEYETEEASEYETEEAVEYGAETEEVPEYDAGEEKLEEQQPDIVPVDESIDSHYFEDNSAAAGDFAATRVIVTDKNGAGLVVDPAQLDDHQPFLYVKTFDNTPINIATDILPSIQVKVQYDADPNPDTPANWTDLADVSARAENLTMQWWDSGCNDQLEEAPTDAGSYALSFAYDGKEGSYRPSGNAFIRVRIGADKVYIKPLRISTNIYSGMTAQDVVNKISYQVLLKSNNALLDIDQETFWGVACNAEGFKQAYTPVFQLMYAGKDGATGDWERSGGSILYRDCNALDVLDSDKKYIAVFSGLKAAYFDSGIYPVDILPINEKSVNSACANYDVLVDEKTLRENYVDIDLKKADQTEIDVTQILKGGKGGSAGDPIISFYNGEKLYNDRTEYKKAVVRNLEKKPAEVIASDTDSKIHYRWQKLNGEFADGNDGQELPYEYLSDSDPNNQPAPCEVGSYRLEIAFSNDDNTVADSTRYVYYEIQPQFVMLEASGEYTAYAGTTAGEFLNRYKDKIGYAIKAITDNVYAPVAVAGETLDLPADSYELTWSVERSVKNQDGTATGEYVKVDEEEPFEADQQYRLMASLRFSDDKYLDHRMDYGALPGKKCCFNTPLKINVVLLGGAKVELVVNADQFSMDPAQSGQVYKVYDGKAVTVSNIGELVTVLDATDGQEITDFPKDQLGIRWTVTYDDGKTALVSAPKDAGSYTMAVYFPGNETYSRIEPDDQESKANIAEGICRIGRRDLTITPVAKGSIKAGSKFAPESDFPLSSYRFDGVADSDADAFSYRKYSHFDAGYGMETEVEAIEAFVCSYSFGPDYAAGFKTAEISDKGGSKNTDQRYKSNTEYYAKTTMPKNPSGAEMAEPYCYNYQIINAEAVHTAVRVGSQINKDKVNLRVETKDGVRRVIPCEGLPYKSKFKDVDGTDWLEGNYFIFKIKAPEEFHDPDADGTGYSALFAGSGAWKNSIGKAGAAITGLDNITGDITVAFPVAAETENAKFEIVWQSGFAETFEAVLEKALLCSDTTKAVLPKSMKFSNPPKKMAVGELQQLNLTVVKKQIADVVRIGYSVSDDTVLSITRNGAVTALNIGKATVSAYPIKIVDDKEVPIPGGMVVKTTITVCEVAKPVITGVTALDNVITIRYKEPANGYRREFYVLEGKRTVDEFETCIATYINNDWRDVFATAPVYGDGLKDSKTGARIKVIGNSFYTLEYNKEYTVYVRNVSGVRTLYNGRTVVSSAAGSVKTVMTTRENAQDLDIVLDEKYAVSEGVDYEVPLADKSAQTTAYGVYHECHENAAAESFDLISKKLPLSAEEQAIYINPKLSYYVTSPSEDYYEDAQKAKACGHTVKIGGRYYYPSKIASIDKKGRLTVKGLGVVRVRVYNSVRDIMSYKDVRITAEVNAFSGRSGTAKVGQKLDLNLLLDYYANGKKVNGYPGDFADPHAVASEDETEWFLDDAGMFIAKQPGTYMVSIRDDVISKNGGYSNETNVEVRVLPMEPAKGLKTIFAYDAFAKIKFTYSKQTLFAGGRTSEEEHAAGVDFRVDVRDTADRLIYSQFIDGEKYNTENEKVREYHCLIDGLSQRSAYKVSVIAFYGEQESKPARKTIKTTGVPASYMDMDDVYEYVTADHYDGSEAWYRRTKVSNAENGYYDIDGKTYDYHWSEPECLPESQIANTYQGVHIEAWGINEFEWGLDEHPFFTSGSTYVLRTREDDLGGFKKSYLYPKEAMSDTLIWKVGDSSIASVRALKGSFSAKLKAAKPGATTLEVRSKNTKKVIARYRIKIKAVGDGHDFFGEYDDFYNDVQWDPAYEKAVEVLCVGNPLTIEQTENEYTWICYEAKVNGVHTFSKFGGNDPDSIRTSSQNRYGKSSGWRFKDLEAGVYLYEGMKLYMKVEGPIHNLMVECTPTVGMTSGTITVEDPLDMTFSYRAPAEGCYTFSSDLDFFKSVVKVTDESASTPLLPDIDYRTETNAVHVRMKRDETIRMTVKGTNETKRPYTITVTARHYSTLSSEPVSVEIVKDQDAWFKFTAPEDGGYVFRTSEASGALIGTYYDSLDKWKEDHTDILENDGDNTAPYRLEMLKGDTVAFRLTTDAEKAAAKVSMTAETMRILTVEEPVRDMPADGAGTVAWIKFDVPESGKYSWNLLSHAVVDTDYRIFYRKNSITAQKMPFSNLPDEVLNEGETIYITVESLTNTKKTFTLSVSKVKGKKLEEDDDGVAEDILDDVTDGQEQWYTFTASEAGIYGFCIAKTSSDGRPISVSEYENVGDTSAVSKTPALNVSGISVHRWLAKGETVVFKITAGNISNPNTKSTVSVRVSRCIFTAPEEDGAVRIDKNAYGHYKLSISETGKYNILVKSGEGSFDLTEAFRADQTAERTELTALTGLTKDVTFTGISLNEGEELYFILRQSGGDTEATGTITAELIKDGTDDEDIDETITLGENESKWFSYHVTRDGRYYIAASGGCTAEWYDAYDDGAPHVPDTVIGDVFKAGKTVYIKVTKDAEAGDVCLIIEKIEPGALKTGSEGTVIKTNKDDHTWYRFTSPETAYYQFDYAVTNDEGSAQCRYYEAPSCGGDYIKTMTDGTCHVIFMEKDDCIDFHFYDAAGSTDAVMKVGKIIADGTIVSDDKKPESVVLSSDSREVWYHFEAPTDGNYSFEIGGATGTEEISYFVSRADDPASEKRYIYMPAALISSSMALQKGDKVLIRLATDAEEATVEVSISIQKMWILTVDEPIVDLPVEGKDTTAWIKFVVPESGKYSWKLDTSAEEGTDYEIYYRKNSVKAGKRVFAGLPDEILNRDEIIYVTIESLTDDAKKFSLSVSKIDDRDLTGGEDDPAEDERTDVTDGKELWYTFTAPSYGLYEFCIKETTGYRNIEVHEYGKVGGTEQIVTSAPLLADGSIVHRLLNQDEKVIFKITADIDGSASGTASGMPSTVSVKVEKCRFTAPEDGGVFTIAAGQYGHYSLTASESGMFDLLVAKTGGSFEIVGAYQEDAAGKLTGLDGLEVDRAFKSVLMRTGESLYFIFREDRGAAAAGTIKAVKSSDAGTGEDTGEEVLTDGVQSDVEMTDGDEQWYSFTAAEFGSYEFYIDQTPANLREITLREYRNVGDADELVVDAARKLKTDGSIVHRVLQAGNKVVFKITAGSIDSDAVSTISVKISKCDFDTPGNGGAITVDADKYGHYKLTVSEAGMYDLLVAGDTGSFEIIAAYQADAAGRLADLEELEIDTTLTGVLMRTGEALYFILRENNGADATGTITAVKSHAGTGSGDDGEKTLESDADGVAEDVRDDVTDDQVLWYGFTAPSYGFYELSVTKTSADTRTIKAEEYNKVNGKRLDVLTVGEIRHRVLNAGQKIILKITAGSIPDPDTKTTVSVKIAQCKFENLADTDGAVSIASNDYGHYRLEASDTGKYNVLVKEDTPGSFALEGAYREDDLTTKLSITVGSILSDVSMRKGKSLYFILKGNGVASPATGTITADQVIDLGDGGKADETISFEAGETKWFTYHAKQKGRYYITTTPADGCEVKWGTDANDVTKPVNGKTGHIFNAGQPIYIKVTKNSTAGSVKLTVERVSPVSLQEGTAYAGISMNPADHSWYSFTADMAGDYLFEYDTTETGGAACGYYQTVAEGGAAITGLSLSKGSSRIIAMTKDKSYDLHFYDEDLPGNKASIKVVKISDTIGLNDPKEVTLKQADSEKWYRFTAEKAGDYRLETVDEDAVNSMEVTYFTKDSASDSPVVYNPVAGAASTVHLENLENVFVRLRLGAGVLSASANAIMMDGEMLSLNANPIVNGWQISRTVVAADTTTWVRFDAPYDGWYRWNLETADASAGKFYRKASARGEYTDFGSIPNELHQDDVFYIKINGTTSFSLSVSKIDEELTLDTTQNPPSVENTVEMADGEERWFSFTAPKYGFYEFGITVARGAVDVKEYHKVGDPAWIDPAPEPVLTTGKIVHRLLAKDRTVVFKIIDVTDNAPSKVIVTVTQCVFKEPGTPGIGGSVTVSAGEYDHYKLTAQEDGLYNVLVESNSADFKIETVCRDNLATSLSVWTDRTLAFEKNEVRFGEALASGESLYFIVKNNNASLNASVSISMYPVKNLGGGGNVQERVSSLKAGEDRWYSYQVWWDARYYISASNGCNVELYKKNDDNILEKLNRPNPDDPSSDPQNNYTEVGNALFAGETIYIKVLNLGLNETSPMLDIERVWPGILKEDSAERHLETKKGDHSWYRFTAPATEKYLFEYTRSGDAICRYYNTVTSDPLSYGYKIDEITSGAGRVISMEQGQTIDFHFYDSTEDEGSTGTMKITPAPVVTAPTFVNVSMPEGTPAPIGGSMLEVDRYYEADLSSSAAWYQFDVSTASDNYRCITNADSTTRVKYFVKLPSSPANTYETYEAREVNADSYIEYVAADTVALIRLESTASNASVRFSVIDQEVHVVSLGEEGKLERTDITTNTYKPMYFYLKDTSNDPNVNYILESTGVGSTYWCQMDHFGVMRSGDGDGGIPNPDFREIFKRVNRNDHFGESKIYRLIGTDCELSLTRVYDVAFNDTVYVDVEKESNAYVEFKAPHRDLFAFTTPNGWDVIDDSSKVERVTYNSGRKNVNTEISKIRVMHEPEDLSGFEMSKDGYIYLKLKNADTSSVKRAITAQRQGPVNLSSKIEQGGESKGVNWGLTRWFKYKLREDHEYTFICYSEKSKLEFYLYNDYLPDDVNNDSEPEDLTNKTVTATMEKGRVVYFKVVNTTDKNSKDNNDVAHILIMDSLTQTEEVKELGSISNYIDITRTKKTGKQHMEFYFTPDEDGYYDFEFIEVPDEFATSEVSVDDLKVSGFWADPQITDTGSHRYGPDNKDGKFKEHKRCFIPQGKTVKLVNTKPYNLYRSGDVKIRITKHTDENAVAVRLTDNDWVRVKEKAAWDDPSYDVFRYDVPENRNPNMEYTYQVFLCGVDVNGNVDETAPCYAQGINVRDTMGDGLNHSSVWYNEDKKHPDDYIDQSLEFKIDGETKKIYITVFVGKFPVVYKLDDATGEPVKEGDEYVIIPNNSSVEETTTLQDYCVKMKVTTEPKNGGGS